MSGEAERYPELFELSEAERAELALELIRSLDAPDLTGDLTDAEYIEELNRRADNAVSGRTTGIPWEQIKATILQRR